MKRNQRVCLLYWTTWVVGALLVFLAENEIIPTGYATGVQTAYYLNLTAIVLTLTGIYVGLKFFHIPFVKRHIGTAPSATAALARWTSLRLIGMMVVIWADLLIYYATLSSQGGFCALLALLGYVFCRPAKFPDKPEQNAHLT